jgi:hypothetical protein
VLIDPCKARKQDVVDGRVNKLLAQMLRLKESTTYTHLYLGGEIIHFRVALRNGTSLRFAQNPPRKADLVARRVDWL